MEKIQAVKQKIFKIQNSFHQQMLSHTIKISLYSLLHVLAQVDHPQGAYAEPH